MQMGQTGEAAGKTASTPGEREGTAEIPVERPVRVEVEEAKGEQEPRAVHSCLQQPSNVYVSAQN